MAGMVKLERLLDLITVLMEAGRPLTRHEIRATLPDGAYSTEEGAFLKAFDRDKKDIRSLGIALVREQVPGEPAGIEGYRLNRSSVGADLPTLESDEATSLALAAAVVRIDPDRPGTPIWRLAGAADDVEAGAVGLPTTDVPGGETVRSLMGAVTERRVVTFGYRDEVRTVEPHRLVFAKGRWQMIGHDRLRDDVRQFRSDRIKGGVTVTDETFEPPDVTREVEVDHAWRFDGGTGDGGVDMVVRVRVDARHVAWVEGFLGVAADIERTADGSAIVAERVRDLAAFRSFVLTFLDGAEVLGPPEARADMVEWLSTMAAGPHGSADRDGVA